MGKIRVVANILRYILLAIMITLPILHFLLWLCADPIQAATSSVVSVYWPTWTHIHANWKLSLLGGLIDSVGLIFDMLICYFLVRLFKLYSEGQIFSLDNVACFRNLGLAVLFGKLATYIEQPLLSYVMTWMQNPNDAEFTVNFFRSTDLSVILFAVFLIIISWIMGEAVKLNEEQELTI